MGYGRASSFSSKHALASGLFVAAVVLEPRALAYESEVSASVDAQYYAFQSPYGEPVIRRRRYTDTLGLALYDLGGEGKPGGPRLSFRSRLRLDADLGVEPAERDPSSDRYVPGLEQAPLDLMYAYLEGEGYLGGVVGFRVGRQLLADSLGFWAFDGGLVSVTTPAYVRLEAYGGLEERSGLPMLTTPRYQADGVARGSRDDLRADQWTSYLEQSRVAPAFGFAIESIDLDFLHLRAGYRRVQNRDTVAVSPFADELLAIRTTTGGRVSSEKAGASARLESPELGAVTASLVYDLVAGLTSDVAVGMDYYATDRITFGLDAERVVPTYDGDSIFNWFSHSPLATASARVDLGLSRRLDVSADGGVRLFETLGDPEASPGGSTETRRTREADPFAALSGRYRYGFGTAAARGMLEHGERGHRYGVDLSTTRTFDAGYYDTLVVVSLYDWQDALRADRHATSFSYVIGAGLSPGLDLFNVGRLGFEWEHAMNRLVGQRFRALATLDFSVLR